MLASKARELMRLAPRGVRGLQTSAPAAGGMGLPVKYARAPETPVRARCLRGLARGGGVAGAGGAS